MADTFQWERCDSSGASCSDIGGATSASYTLQAADVGHTIRSRGTRDSVLIGDSGSGNPTAVITASGPTPPSGYTPNKFFNGGTGTNMDSFLASLVPGDIAGLTGICKISASIDPASGRGHAGTAASPIIITSNDWAHPATVQGRLVMFGAAAYWTWDYAFFDDNQTAQPTSWAIGGHHNIFRRLDCTNHNSHIGFNFIYDPTYGQSHDNLVSRCRIYEIGPESYDNRSHGIYNLGTNNTAEDNIIYECSARGIQDREGTNGSYNYNIVDDCGVGIIVGDLTGSHGLRGTKNIFSNVNVPGNYLIETYNNGSGSNNVLDDNFVFNGGVMPSLQNLTCTNVHTSDPQYVNQAARNYALQGGSPATGYGPRASVGPT